MSTNETSPLLLRPGEHLDYHYTRLVNRDGSFNVHRRKRKYRHIIGNIYHTLLDITWYKLLIIFTVYYIMVHLIFAFLYYLGGDGSLSSNNLLDYLSFSVQTMESIGYGATYPTSAYANFIVFFQSWWSILSIGCITGIAFTKIARPSRMKKMILFSHTAVVNTDQLRYVGNVDQLEHGKYIPGDELSVEDQEKGYKDWNSPCLIFRMANVGKSQLCSTQLRLLLLQRPRRVSPPSVSEEASAAMGSSSDSFSESSCLKNALETACQQFRDGCHTTFRFVPEADSDTEELIISELNYELNRQIGRVRSVNLSLPLLPLPWLVVHPLDRTSPLYGYTPQKFVEMRCEIIPVLEAVNEAVSDSFQARHSYVANEIVWNSKFVPILSTQGENYVVDYSKFHDVVPVSSHFRS